MIFHLSYLRNDKKQSVNSNTPTELSRVIYPQFDATIKHCLEEGVDCYLGMFRFFCSLRYLGMRVHDFCWLAMKAQNPKTGKWCYFVDKCLPFGTSISCTIFQEVLDAIVFVVKHSTRKTPINYLDDYLFIAFLKSQCNDQVEKFIQICKDINFPINLDKTFWASTILTFLGLLIDTVHQMVAIPNDKIVRAINMITHVLGKKNRKITIHLLQKICGYLNFLR